MKIERPFINISGGLQPSILSELAKENRDSNGFLQRICFAFPDVCERPPHSNERISEMTKRMYVEYIDTILEDLGKKEDLGKEEEPWKLSLSDQANILYARFYNKNTDLSNKTQADYLKAMYAKLDYISLRLAIVIHICKWAMNGEVSDLVSGDTMKAAIDITEYYRITGTKVFNALQNSEGDSLDKKVVAKYLRSLGASQNEISQALKVSQQYIDKILKKL